MVEGKETFNSHTSVLKSLFMHDKKLLRVVRFKKSPTESFHRRLLVAPAR